VNADDILELLTFFVSGRWQEMDGREEDAREFVLEVTQKLKHHDAEAVQALFAKTRKCLLTRGGKWSPERIRQEPAFSQSALENMIRLARAWKSAGDEGFRDEWKRIFVAVAE